MQNIKLVIIGDSLVGKTALLLRFTDDYFAQDHMTTIGINYKVKNLQIQDKKIRVQIWDTAGQERLRVLPSIYYKGAQGIFLAYDITSMKSFQNVSNWMFEIRKHNSSQIPVVLAATKLDLAHGRQVPYQAGVQLASSLQIKFFQTSSKTNEGVSQSFYSLIRQILSTDTLPRESICLTSKPKTRKNCCKS